MSLAADRPSPSPGTLLGALATPGRAGPALRQLDAAGALTAVLPELELGRGFAQPELHYYDVLQHNLAAVDALDEALSGEGAGELRGALAWLDLDENLARTLDGVAIAVLTRLACLVHDIAKPATAVIIDGRLRFPRHGPEGATLLRKRLPELGLGPVATDFVARMVRHHLRPAELVRPFPPTDHAVRRFVADLDGHVIPLLLVHLADGWATRGPRYTREDFRRHCGFINYVIGRSLAATDEGPPYLVHGEDLMTALGLKSGPALGAVLTSVRRAQMDGLVSDRSSALAFARQVLARMPGPTPGNDESGRSQG